MLSSQRKVATSNTDGSGEGSTGRDTSPDTAAAGRGSSEGSMATTGAREVHALIATATNSTPDTTRSGMPQLDRSPRRGATTNP